MDRERLRRRIAQHPKAVRFDELQRLLEAYGFERVRIRGSHHIFVRGAEIQVVPLRRPHVKAIYVEQVLQRLKEENQSG